MAEWKINDFSGGLNENGMTDNTIAENEASDCQNVIATKIGSLTKCKGQVKINSSHLGGAIQGVHPYYYGANRKLVVAASGNIIHLNTNGTYTTLQSGWDTTANVDFETMVNYMVAFNGINAPIKYDGTIVSTLANAPTDGQFAVLYKEKLFTVPKSAPSSLWWSDSFEPENWPAINYWDVQKGDGDVITALIPYIGELVIFKRYSTHSLKGTSLDDFRLDLIDPHIGAVGPRAVVFEGMYLYVIHDDGIYVFNGAKYQNISRMKINWDKINKQYLYKAVAGRWDGLLWFALPEGNSTINNLVLFYNPQTGAWWQRRGIDATCFQEYNGGTQLKYYAGGTDGFVREQWNGYTDDGQAINSYWQGKAFDLGAPEYPKKGKKVFITDSPGANDVAVEYALDYGDMQQLEIRKSSELVREFKVPRDYFHYVMPKLVHNVAGNFEVRGQLLIYKAKEKPKVW